jgi:hypothetical protein
MFGLLLFGFAHAFIYNWISVSWPKGVKSRTLRLTVLIFFVYLFWEFFTPFNLFGEPILLIGLQLIFWAIIAIAESFVITIVSEKKF